MIIVEGDSQAEARKVPRPWWFAPALLGIGLGALVGIGLPSPSELPSPSDKTRAQHVIDRLAAIGITADRLGDTQFDTVLGSALPAQNYDLDGYGGAYVVFLDSVYGPAEIRVCDPPDHQGKRVYFGGQETSSVNGAPFVFLVNSRYFVAAPDQRTAAVLQRGLDVTPADC